MQNINRLSTSIDFIEQLAVPIFVKNQTGFYISCNTAFSTFLGLEKNKILGKTAYEIASVALADVYTKADRELFDSSQKQSYSAAVSTAKSTAQIVTFAKSVIYQDGDQIAGFICSIQLQPTVNVNFSGLTMLTPGERAILDLLFVGKSVKSIAIQLALSSHTVMGYTKSIYAKLGVHSKNEAIYRALTLLTVMANP
jgi:PAS domain S-box-containing protein